MVDIRYLQRSPVVSDFIGSHINDDGKVDVGIVRPIVLSGPTFDTISDVRNLAQVCSHSRSVAGLGSTLQNIEGGSNIGFNKR